MNCKPFSSVNEMGKVVPGQLQDGAQHWPEKKHNCEKGGSEHGKRNRTYNVFSRPSGGGIFMCAVTLCNN